MTCLYHPNLVGTKKRSMNQETNSSCWLQYIYLASSTLLAHALLRLDGRAAALKPMCEMENGSTPSADDTEELDWGAFVDVSSSCLILLAWCGERWPGMLRMLGVYQRLFGQVTRALIRLGVVK